MNEKRHPLEWLLLGISALVVVTVLTGLVYMTFRAQEKGVMPLLELTCVPQKRVPGGRYRISVTLNNRGLGPAEHVTGEVELGDDKVDFQVDRLSGQGSHELFVFFKEDPRGREVKGSITSFQVP